MSQENSDNSDPTLVSLQTQLQYLERELLTLTMRLFHLEFHAMDSSEYTPPDYARFFCEQALKN